MTVRIGTIIVSVLDAAVWAVLAFSMFMSGSDPATKGLDEVAGVSVTALLLITAAPALGLILFGRALKTALTLALAFPAALAALFIAANIALAADNPVRASAGADVMSPIGSLQTSLGIAFSSRPSKAVTNAPFPRRACGRCTTKPELNAIRSPLAAPVTRLETTRSLATKKSRPPRRMSAPHLLAGSTGLEVVHAAHAASRGHPGRGLLLGLFGHHRLGRDQQAGDGGGILQRHPHDLGRVD